MREASKTALFLTSDDLCPHMGLEHPFSETEVIFHSLKGISASSSFEVEDIIILLSRP